MSQVFAFTAKADGRRRVLDSPAFVSQAFDPAKSEAPPHFKEFRAIWDTGATGTVITGRVVEECSLKPIGMVKVHTVGGEKFAEVYLITIRLPNNVAISQLRVTRGDISGGDILIGMDIISQGDFAVTNKDGKTMFSFRLPSIEYIDFVEQFEASKKLPAKRPSRKIGRNEPCPCGSGKKYKKCCGKTAP